MFDFCCEISHFAKLSPTFQRTQVVFSPCGKGFPDLLSRFAGSAAKLSARLTARPAAVVLVFSTVAVLLLLAMDRYHIVSQFKQRERVVIIDPAGDPKP